MSPLFFRLFQRLLPNSRAWRITARLTKALEQFFGGLSEVYADAREHADLAARDLYVDETRVLARHQRQFGLAVVGSTADQLAAARAAWAATGGQSPGYLQGVLQEAGFDLYVHEWWGSGTPRRLLGELLVGWWSFEAANVELVAGEVDSVTDLSGGDHALEAADASARLAYLENAGPGAERSVGSADDLPDNTLVASGYDFETGDRPCFAGVLRLNAAISNRALLGLIGPGGGYWTLRSSSSDKFQFLVEPEGGGTELINGPDIDTDWHLFEFYQLAAGWVFAVDGIEFTSAETAGVGASSDGGPDTFSAPHANAPVELRELMLLADEPNAEQRAAIRNYFAHRYEPLGLSVVARDPREYTEQPLSGTVQCGEELALCGEPDALCSNFLVNEVNYLVNQAGTPNAPPGIPDDEYAWRYFLYFGGPRFPDHATVPEARRHELYKLVLKLCPERDWLVLLIDWDGTTAPATIQTNLDEDIQDSEDEALLV